MARGLIPWLLAWWLGKPARAESVPPSVHPVCQIDPKARLVYRDLSRPYAEGRMYRISCQPAGDER